MANVPSYFETVDLQGSTDAYNGTVGTSWTAIPTVADNVIQSALVVCVFEQGIAKELYVSFDGGTTTAAKLAPGGYISTNIKGRKTQIHIKGNVASVSYEVTLNREAN